MTQWLRRRAVLASACLLAAVLAGCGGGGGGGGDDDATKRTAIRIQLNWVPEPEFGGLYAALEQGFFTAEGLDVELVAGGPGVAAPQLVASGNVPFAIVGGEQILTLREQGGEIVALFATFQDDPMGLMVHAANPHASLEELWRSETKVACEANLSWVEAMRRRVPDGRVQIVPHTGSLAQFVADPTMAQQCFIFAEPVALEVQGVPTRVFLAKESGFNPYNVVLATSAAHLREQPELCGRVVRAVQRGWEHYLAEPRPTNEIMHRLNPSMSVEAMDIAAAKQAALIANDATRSLGLGAMTSERWREIAESLRELGKITTVPEPADVFRWPAPDRGTTRP
jgi:NitT/TauT family transport system substrate-binding protein